MLSGSILPWLFGFAVGAAVSWLWQATRLARIGERLRSTEERLAWIHTAEEQLRTSFRELAGEALERNGERFAARSAEQVERAVADVARTLDGLGGEVRALERAREGAYAGMQREIALLRDAHQRLRDTAGDLAEALRAPAARGRWGEVQLRRVVEMAGLAEHVDFVEQVTTGDGQRPDMVIQLPGDAILPVDAKAPLGAFLDAAEARDERARERCLDAHLRAVRARIAELSGRAYWRAFERAPDFVVMFVPNDAALAAAFARDPTLLDFALGRRVLPATPVTLLALLKSVAVGWQQQRVADNARTIAAQGTELFARLGTFLEHLQRLGRGLDGAVAAFNQSVGSLERRVMPAVRRLQAAGTHADPAPEVEPVERAARRLDVAE